MINSNYRLSQIREVSYLIVTYSSQIHNSETMNLNFHDLFGIQVCTRNKISTLRYMNKPDLDQTLILGIKKWTKDCSLLPDRE